MFSYKRGMSSYFTFYPYLKNVLIIPCEIDQKLTAQNPIFEIQVQERVDEFKA